MSKSCEHRIIDCSLSLNEDLPCSEFDFTFVWNLNPAFQKPCLSFRWPLIPRKRVFTQAEYEAARKAFKTIEKCLKIQILKTCDEIWQKAWSVDDFAEILQKYMRQNYPSADLSVAFRAKSESAYKNQPVMIDEDKLWRIETERQPDIDYLFDMFDQWVALSEKAAADEDALREAFDSFAFCLGDKLAKNTHKMPAVNFFISPLSDLFNVTELIKTAERAGGTLWSTNRYCSYGDIILFYYTKDGGKDLKKVGFQGQCKDFFENLSGGIFASARLFTDSMRQEKKGLFYWHSKAFIGDIKIFDVPVLTDNIVASDGISLTSYFRNSRGGLRQPKSLYGEDEYLSLIKQHIFALNPALKDTYLAMPSYWPKLVPKPESKNWAEEMGLVDARAFKNKNPNLNKQHVENVYQDEEGVRKMFIDPLLARVIPADARLKKEYKTNPEKNIRVDYCILKDGIKLPVEAKFEIKTDRSIDWKRVREYLEISYCGHGLLIDMNGVYALNNSSESRELIFEREKMNESSVQKLRAWISHYFRKSRTQQ